MFNKLIPSIEKRATVSLFGVDLKITPDNEVKIIEINGARSGMNGFRQCYDPEGNMEAVASLGMLDWFDYRNYFPGDVARRADIYWLNYLGFLKDSLHNKPVLTFQGGCSLLEKHVSRIERFHELEIESGPNGDYLVSNEKGVNCSELGLEFLKEEPLGKEETEFLMRLKDAEAIIWNKSDPCYWKFDEKRHLVINQHTIESAIDDKCVFYKKMIPVAKGILPRTIDFSLMKGYIFETDLTALKNTNSIFEDLARWDCNAYILKPANGSCGKDVYFFPKENLVYDYKFHLKPLKTLQEKGLYRLYSYSDTHKPEKLWIMGFLLQEFIESKPIYSRKTSAYHDGCMRMIVVMQSEKGKIKSMQLGGYWRLAPSPLNSGNSQTSHIANLSNHAIPEMASEEEIDFAWKKIKEPMKMMYGEMLKIPILKSEPLTSKRILGKD